MRYTSFIFALIFIAQTAFGAVIADDTLTLGKSGSSANKSIRFGAGSSAVKPQIRFNTGSSLLEFSNNGTDFLGIGSGGGGGTGVNLLQEQNKNPDFETGLTGWTASGFTPTIASSGSDLLFGKGSAVFTATAAGQTFKSALVTVTYGLQNSPCLAQVYYKGGDANLTMKVLDGSANLIAQRVMTASADRSIFGVPFFCGAQGTQYQISIESTAAAAKIAVDRSHLGEYGLGTFVDSVPLAVQRFTTAGTFTYTPTAGTRFARVTIAGGGGGGGGSNTTSLMPGTAGTATTFGALATANGGGAGSGGANGAAGGLGGTATTTAPAIPVIVYTGGSGQGSSNAPSAGGMGGANAFGGAGSGSQNTAANNCTPGIAPGAGGGGAGGTSNSAAQGGSGGGAGGYAQFIVQNPVSTSVTVGANGVGNTSGSFTGCNGAPGVIIVEEFGYAGGLAVTPQTSGWFADGNLGSTNSSNFTLSNAAVTTRSVIGTTGTMSMIQNSPSTIPIGIVCSGVAGVPGVMTCSSGQPQVGAVVDIPTAGKVEVCAQFAHQINVGTANAAAATQFRWVETDALATTEGQVAGELSNSYLAMSTAAVAVEIPHRNCGVMDFATSGRKYLRLKYTQALGGAAPTASLVMADRNVNLGTRDVHITVRPVSQNVPAPVLVGPFANMPSGAVTAATYAILPSDTIVDFDTTANAITATLPSAVGMRGKTIVLSKKNNSANLVTIVPQAGQSIAGNPQTVMHGYGESIELYSDGAIWQWRSSNMRTEMFAFGGTTSGNICTTSPCFKYQGATGNWINSISRSAAGNYFINAASNVFSGPFHCSGAVANANNAITMMQNGIPTSSTSGFATVNTSTQAAVDGFGQGHCTGPR